MQHPLHAKQSPSSPQEMSKPQNDIVVSKSHRLRRIRKLVRLGRANPIRTLTLCVLLASVLVMTGSNWARHGRLSRQIDNLNQQKQALELEIAKGEKIWTQYAIKRDMARRSEAEINRLIADFDNNNCIPRLRRVLTDFDSEHLILLRSEQGRPHFAYLIKPPNDNQVLMVRVTTQISPHAFDRVDREVTERYVRLNAHTVYELQFRLDRSAPDAMQTATVKLDDLKLIEKEIGDFDAAQREPKPGPFDKPWISFAPPVSVETSRVANESGVKLPLWRRVDQLAFSLRSPARQVKEFEMEVRILDWKAIHAGAKALKVIDLTLAD